MKQKTKNKKQKTKNKKQKTKTKNKKQKTKNKKQTKHKNKNKQNKQKPLFVYFLFSIFSFFFLFFSRINNFKWSMKLSPFMKGRDFLKTVYPELSCSAAWVFTSLRKGYRQMLWAMEHPVWFSQWSLSTKNNVFLKNLGALARQYSCKWQALS